ncbi:ATP-binding cassette domain-containing protein [Clostridium sp. SM-530-WT-3G]|uniref:sulfate/molybdate ABC transporter ATP-binding protein n=1 Tax=Clostridium sp. SM-530-WT-3G TaxID=2725303 RepID=UPI00145EE424|nr:ATP-binding cassette domain-containing protein [Clostridium sp. SM-530-WT-3G]NME82478.1 ATP-binding cassette domain-containing protein [Clostridium sp. SM-530-WT-3G]
MGLDINIENNLSSFILRANFKQEHGILGLLGASGSGKSMTLKAIAGLIKPTKGYIKINNKVLFDSEKKINLRPQERNVGLLFQNYALFPHMTVAQNIECGIMKMDESKRKALVEDYIERFKLSGLEKRYPKELSGGQMQRVALARTLITNPDILLLDEPFSALDINLKSTIERDLISILKEYNGIVLYVTHDISEAYRICDEIIVYDNGTALNKNDKDYLFNHPESITEAKITGCTNIFKAYKNTSSSIYAEDIGYSFYVGDNITKNINYIGIRDHNIIISSNLNNLTDIDNNIFKFKIVDIIENPFTYTLILKNPLNTFNETIEAEVSKDSFSNKINDIIYAQFKSEYLFYF